MSMGTQSRRTFYQDNDFIIEIEDYLGALVLHCEVSNWKPSVLRKGYSIFAKLEQYAIDNGYSKMLSVSPNPKFCKLVGGVSMSEIVYENKKYEVMIWELQQQL